MKKLICFGVLTCAILLMTGCGGGGTGSGSGTAPSIANLTSSPTSVEQNYGGGSTTITSTIEFTDPDGDVSTLTISVFDSSGQMLDSKTNPIGGTTGITSGIITIWMTAPTATVAGYTFQVSITDAGGKSSNTLTGAFNVFGPVTATGPFPAHLTINNGTLFWSEAGVNSIKSISSAGGSPTVLAQKFGVPAGFVVQGQDLFWLEEQSGIASSGCAGASSIRALKKISIGGTTSNVLATGDGCAGGSTDIAVDGTSVYWVTSTSSPNTYTIRKTPVSGGATTAVTTSSVPIDALAIMSGNLYWMENFFPDAVGAIRRMPTSGGSASTITSGFVSRSHSFAVNSTSVFYTQANFPSSDNLIELPLAGGSSSALGTLTNTPIKLAADDSNVYSLDISAVSSLPTAGGTVSVLANTVNTPIDLIIRNSNVLWSETTGPAHGETGMVKSVPKTGGAISILVQGGDAPRLLGGDGSWVYWTEGGAIGQIEGFGRIARVPAGGGTVETVVSGVASDSPPIAVSDTDVFIADGFCIKKVSRTGGAVDKIATASFYIIDLVTDGTYVYWVEDPFSDIRKMPVNGGTVTNLASVSGAPAGPSGPIRLQNGAIYWMTHHDSILTVPVAGGTVRVVASSLPFLSDFVVDGTNIYYSEQDSGNIKKLPVSGGAATTLATGLGGSYNILALDNTNLYWIDQIHIGKVTKSGGTPVFIISGGLHSDAVSPASIALDNSNIYWTEPPGKVIQRVQK